MAAAVVVSHDCDLARPPDIEPAVEVICGCRIEQPDGNYTLGKNPRRLHLPIHGGATAWVDLDAREKQSIRKQDLHSYLPGDHFHLTPGDRTILQLWLARRYRRAAFPDEFNSRLSETGLDKRLARIMEPTGALIDKVYFDLDGGQELTRTGAGDPYELVIYLLYSTGPDPIPAEAAANTVKAQVERAFSDKCYHPDSAQWQQIELVDCLIVSDQAMTVAQSRALKDGTPITSAFVPIGRKSCWMIEAPGQSRSDGCPRSESGLGTREGRRIEEKRRHVSLAGLALRLAGAGGRHGVVGRAQDGLVKFQ